MAEPGTLAFEASLRMLGAATREPDRTNPVAVAEHRTTMNDLRAALNLARGFDPDELDPATGYQSLASMYARRFGAQPDHS
jgi:hypothetical protein